MRKRILLAESSSDSATTAIVQWAQPSKTCREREQRVELCLERMGDLKRECSVQYMSESGTATEGVDFEAARGTVKFAAGQTQATIVVTIIDDQEEEDDETFLVRLHSPSVGCQLGPTSVCEVTIEDDDGPGELTFEAREVSQALIEPSGQRTGDS